MGNALSGCAQQLCASAAKEFLRRPWTPRDGGDEASTLACRRSSRPLIADVPWVVCRQIIYYTDLNGLRLLARFGDAGRGAQASMDAGSKKSCARALAWLAPTGLITPPT